MLYDENPVVLNVPEEAVTFETTVDSRCTDGRITNMGGESPYSTRQYYLEQLIDLLEQSNLLGIDDLIESKADDIICNMLVDMNLDDIVNVYKRIKSR